MFETYKPLYQGKLVDPSGPSNAITIYEPPPGRDSVISLTSIQNLALDSSYYFIGVTDGDPELEGSISAAEALIWNRNIAAGAIDELKGSICLTHGQKLRAFSYSENIYINIFGVELE